MSLAMKTSSAWDLWEAKLYHCSQLENCQNKYAAYSDFKHLWRLYLIQNVTGRGEKEIVSENLRSTASFKSLSQLTSVNYGVQGEAFVEWSIESFPLWIWKETFMGVVLQVRSTKGKFYSY